MPGMTLVRYFSLAGAVDADPLALQPGPDALGPLTVAKGGRVLVNVWEVDGEGRRVVPTPALALTLGVVTLSSVETDQRPPGATSGETLRETFWGRGPLLEMVEPGLWFTQAQLGAASGFSVVVTAKASSPATFLAIWADLSAMGGT